MLYGATRVYAQNCIQTSSSKMGDLLSYVLGISGRKRLRVRLGPTVQINKTFIGLVSFLTQ